MFRYKDFRRFLPRFVMVNLVQHLALMLVKQKIGLNVKILGEHGILNILLSEKQLLKKKEVQQPLQQELGGMEKMYGHLEKERIPMIQQLQISLLMYLGQLSQELLLMFH